MRVTAGFTGADGHAHKEDREHPACRKDVARVRHFNFRETARKRVFPSVGLCF